MMREGKSKSFLFHGVSQRLNIHLVIFVIVDIAPHNDSIQQQPLDEHFNIQAPRIQGFALKGTIFSPC